jgi:hypothetical protein
MSKVEATSATLGHGVAFFQFVTEAEFQQTGWHGLPQPHHKDVLQTWHEMRSK